MPDKRPPALAHERFLAAKELYAGLDLQEAFTRIYETNLWGSADSVSGLGSALDETALLRVEIPALLQRIGARSLLDLPCGDFGWMSRTELPVDCYIGADIVAELVERNQNRFGASDGSRRFQRLDLTSSALPRVDVALCRDCLVHLSHANILRAVANVKRSGIRYLLTTTFLELKENTDIADGDWRPLNFTAAPFFWPAPQDVIVEGCMEGGGAYADKALGLWLIADLPETTE